MKGRKKNVVNVSRFAKKTSPDTFVRSLTYHHGHRTQKAETPCHKGQLKPSCPDCEHNTSNRLAAFYVRKPKLRVPLGILFCNDEQSNAVECVSWCDTIRCLEHSVEPDNPCLWSKHPCFGVF